MKWNAIKIIKCILKFYNEICLEIIENIKALINQEKRTNEMIEWENDREKIENCFKQKWGICEIKNENK